MKIKNLKTGDEMGAVVKNDFYNDNRSPNGRIKNDISSGFDKSNNTNIKNDFSNYSERKDKFIKHLDKYGKGNINDNVTIKNLPL